VFDSELQMVDAAVRYIGSGKSPWGSVELVREWDYRHGRTDILLRKECGALVAIEAKLTRWQTAVDQAYRNTAYAGQAYVLLPQRVAERASQHISQFTMRDIGLCSLTEHGISVHIEAPSVHPLMNWIADLAHSTLDGLSNFDAASKSPRHRPMRRLAA
jgi:hypothetical protein